MSSSTSSSSGCGALIPVGVAILGLVLLGQAIPWLRYELGAGSAVKTNAEVTSAYVDNEGSWGASVRFTGQDGQSHVLPVSCTASDCTALRPGQRVAIVYPTGGTMYVRLDTPGDNVLGDAMCGGIAGLLLLAFGAVHFIRITHGSERAVSPPSMEIGAEVGLSRAEPAQHVRRRRR